MVGPLFPAEVPKAELAIVEIRYSELVSNSILLDVLDLDVVFGLPSDHLVEGLLVALQVEHLHAVLTLSLLLDLNCPLGVIGNHTGANWVVRCDRRLLEHVVENLVVIFKLSIAFEVSIRISELRATPGYLSG